MRILKRILLGLFVFVLVVALGAGGLAVYTLRRMLPQYSGTIYLPGLSAPVTIYRDAKGVPHIFAESAEDLFFAQGYVHAQDRWWQMEFQRHIGQGRIGELTGRRESVLSTDIFIRTVGWNRAAERDLTALGKESRSALDAYGRGVNNYIRGKSGADLAIEYTLLGVTGVDILVEEWQPLHSLAWAKVLTWQLSSNMERELEEVDLLNKHGLEIGSELLQAMYPDYPSDRERIIHAEDLPILPDPPDQQGTHHLPDPLPQVETRLAGGLGWQDVKAAFGSGASNSWVVSGQRSASGKPILANDPHLTLPMPSLFYEIGLHCVTVSAECPYDVVGFSLPATPGILIGHNGRIAWGLTTPGVDTQDLYAIKPVNASEYMVDNELLTYDTYSEVIRFGDSNEQVMITVRETIFGPIITDMDDYKSYSDTGRRPLALKWNGIDPKMPSDIVGAVLAINRAQNWSEFRTALSEWIEPSQNLIYADIDGNIGYQLPGRMPIRAPGHTGLSIVDGSTRQYEWRGFQPFDSLPRSYNPPRGYIVTANNRIAPDAYYSALEARFGEGVYLRNLESNYGYRSQRIVEMLKAEPKHTLASFTRMQADNYNGFAARVMPIILTLSFGTEVPQTVLDAMSKWDYQMHADSPEAALYGMFERRLVNHVWSDWLGRSQNPIDIAMYRTEALLDRPNAKWWDDLETPNTVETRDEILLNAFKQAYAEGVTRMGQDFTTWRWGTLHRIDFVSNPLGLSGISLIEQYVNVTDLPVSGSNLSINATANYGSDEDEYAVTSGSALRMIVDMNHPNDGVGIHPTGQSGHPADANYRSMVSDWQTFRYTVLQMRRDEIERSAANTLILKTE
ncbi:MAG: penicillin acylase family protein [Anaerolineae bacterium]